MMEAAPPEPDSSQDPPAASSLAVAAAGARVPNPCCAKLWRRYQKVENARNLLREGIRLLEVEVKTLQEQNSELSKVCKEERLRGDSAEAARDIESDARELLEKEIIELKSQNSTLQQTQNICKDGNELLRISELEEENRRLKQVLGEERKKITSEKKAVDEEKTKALEMQKILRSETQKSEEYRRVADTERKVASDWKASCERLRREVNEVRAQLTAQVKKTEDALKSAEAEKLKASREKKRADSEKSLAEKNKGLVEVERKNILEEKNRAENLFAKLEEQKKLNEDLQISIQVEKKTAVEEKKRADNLFQKLEEEQKRNACLQRKANEVGAARDVVSSGKYGRQFVDRASESANVKLLKEKLKLKKAQLKHVKNVAKLDKAKNAMIRREFQCIKQDWMQLLSRFNMLDDHLAGGIEGIHALTELKQHPEVHGFEQRLLPNDPVSAPYLGLQAGMVPFGSSVPREYTSYQLPRESCTRPVSGTSSELGPPLGSSLRTKSKSRNRSSFPTSISDEKFMGPQGKDSLLVSSSADIRGKQNSIPLKEGNDTTRQDDRALVQEALKSSVSCGTKVTDRTLAGVRKRKRTKQSLESSACLSSKHDFLHLKSKAHAATSNDLSALQHGNKIIPCVTEGDMENHRRKYLAITDKAASFGCPAKVSSPGGGNACAGSRISLLLSFEEKISGNILMLLSLDNDADEEKYRQAMERPLSPNLPIIRPRRTKIRALEEPRDFGGEAINSCPTSGSKSNAIDFNTCTKKLEVHGTAVQKVTHNDMQLDLSSNRMECRNSLKHISANNKSDATVNISCNAEFIGAPTCNLSCHSVPEENVQNSVASSAVKSAATSVPVLTKGGCIDNPNFILHSCKEVPDKSSSLQICDGSSDLGLENTFGRSEAKGTKLGSDSNSIIGNHWESQKTPGHLIRFMRTKRSSTENIFRYWEKLTPETGKVSKEASIDVPLLEKVSTEQLLHIEEKVSLIFSLLLSGIRFAAEPFANGDYSSLAFLSVKSYMETRWVFLQRDQLNVLVSLIEDFLMNKEVVVCEKMGQKVADANKYHNLDGEAYMQLYTKPATIDQLISACILLGSICAEVDRVDIILEVSYKIVHMGKSNLSWTLLALHVFNSVCGDKYLFPKSGSFLVTAIRLVVLLLESKAASLCLMSSYIQRNMPILPSCEHCPFNMDTVSVDGFISTVLDELFLCSLLWNNRANSNETISSSTHLGSSGLEINCFECCSIFKQGKLADDCHNCPGKIDLCYLTELISLLELFGIYMSCDWTYNNIVVHLLEMLESCMCEEYAAALLVLVSQLGRFFIDDVGYEQRAVTELRNKLSLLMGASFMVSRSVTVQFSAIAALLVLLPLPFDEVIATQSKPISGPFVLQTSQISDWFYQLSKEHQSLAHSFFI